MDSFYSLTAETAQGQLKDGDILIEEIHKLFQMIDNGKGYLEVNEILDLQANIAESKCYYALLSHLEEGVKLNKADENQIISQFLIQAESSNRSGASTNGSSGGKRVGSAGIIIIDWPAFRNTIVDWVTQMGSSSIGATLIDQSGYLTFKDKVTLHQIIVSFFIQSHKDKKLEILNRAHLQMENIERDIENLSIYGVSGMSSLQYQQDVLQQSKYIANNFSAILSDIATNDVALVSAAIERLRAMFDVVCYST